MGRTVYGLCFTIRRLRAPRGVNAALQWLDYYDRQLTYAKKLRTLEWSKERERQLEESLKP